MNDVSAHLMAVAKYTATPRRNAWLLTAWVGIYAPHVSMRMGDRDMGLWMKAANVQRRMFLVLCAIALEMVEREEKASYHHDADGDLEGYDGA